MKRSIAIALAIVCALMFAVYCYSQDKKEKEVAINLKTVQRDFATVYITKDNAGHPQVRGENGKYSSFKYFHTYDAFQKYIKTMPPNSVPLVFDITLSPGVTGYGVATGNCRIQAGKVICQ